MYPSRFPDSPHLEDDARYLANELAALATVIDNRSFTILAFLARRLWAHFRQAGQPGGQQ
jgi:hypothetical protein